MLPLPVAIATALLLSSCASARVRDEHAAQKNAIETMTPIAAPAGPIPAARSGGEVLDSDQIRALETLTPIPLTSRCPKFEIRLQRANGRRGFVYDQLPDGHAKSFLAEHEFYIGLKYSALFWLRPQRPEQPIPPAIYPTFSINKRADLGRASVSVAQSSIVP
jgi:hypothetical protein